MKIIHITPSYKPAFIYGGTISSIAQLCEALTESNQDIEVITTTANGKEELPFYSAKVHTIDGVKITHFNRFTKDHTHFSPSLLWHMACVAFKNRKNLILHIHSWWNLTSLFVCLIAKCRNIPVVLSPRGMLTPYSLTNRNAKIKSLIHFIIGKKLIEHCFIHVTSEKERQDILKIQYKKNITVIPNLVHLPGAAELSLQSGFGGHIKYPANTFKLLFLSRIEEKKGLELLFNALQYLHFPWQLTIAGTGKDTYVKTLKKLSSDLKISSSIRWAGQINDSNKYKVMNDHDLLVLFSYNENFANVVAESLTIGLPVAISNMVGLASFIVRHDLGWVSELNSGAIASTLKQAHEDHEKRKRIKKAAPGLISTHFSTKGIIDQYLNLYKRSL